MTVRVKICGLSTEATMHAAVDAGAEYVGLVFFPKSPRNVSLADAARLAAIARGRASVVALLVNPSDDQAKAVMDTVAPDFIQLHGDETLERTFEIATVINRTVIKAIPVLTKADAAQALNYRRGVYQILFDAKPLPGALLPGGNGLAFDWTVLSDMRKEFPFILSGGLTPANVQDAIRTCDPMTVDVSSGVENAPGVKDEALIKAFIKAAKGAN
jgi:phosphoribosylanthranilate isomerase